jgi:uncharacterized membrane protein
MNNITQSDHLVASVVSRILKLGLTISLAGLIVGLILHAMYPESMVGNNFMMWGLMVLVLTPPLKSLVLGLIYLRERKWLLAAAAIAVFVIVMAVWYWK